MSALISGISQMFNSVQAFSGGGDLHHVTPEGGGGAAASSGGGFNFEQIGGAVGALGEGLSQYQAVKGQQALMEANAALLEARARDMEVAASSKKARADRRRRALIAQQVAATADAGALTGSNYAAIEQNNAELNLDSLVDLENENYAARNTGAQAGIMRQEAKMVGGSAWKYLAGGGAKAASVFFNGGGFNPFAS